MSLTEPSEVSEALVGVLISLTLGRIRGFGWGTNIFYQGSTEL